MCVELCFASGVSGASIAFSCICNSYKLDALAIHSPTFVGCNTQHKYTASFYLSTPLKRRHYTVRQNYTNHIAIHKRFDVRLLARSPHKVYCSNVYARICNSGGCRKKTLSHDNSIIRLSAALYRFVKMHAAQVRLHEPQKFNRTQCVSYICGHGNRIDAGGSRVRMCVCVCVLTDWMCIFYTGGGHEHGFRFVARISMHQDGKMFAPRLFSIIEMRASSTFIVQ